jgi:hypothetical protein
MPFYLRLTLDGAGQPGLTEYPTREAAKEAFDAALRPQPWTGPGRAPEGEPFDVELLDAEHNVLEAGRKPGRPRL